MTEAMQAIDLKNLDKSGWKTYRFDEIAKNISERVDPNNTNLEVYIGLEHIDPESIHIKRTGTPDDVDGQKLRCYPGDVIFGRRRAYQRKAAIATTDGFCSAHALVLRANPEVIDPRLFPFFLHSDAFMHRAVDISVGSLSPTINWGTIKHQEFMLPPKDQQAKLAELFLVMDKVIVNEGKVLNKIEVFEKKHLSKLINDLNSKDKKEITLAELYQDKLKSVNPKEYGSTKVFHYSLPSFIENKAPEIVAANDINSNKILIDRDVVLFSKLNPTSPKIWAVEKKDDRISLGSTEWLPVIPTNEISIGYLDAYLSSQLFTNKVMKFVQGTSNSHKRIDPKRFYELKMPLLSKKYRRIIEDIHQLIVCSRNKTLVKITSSQFLQKKLINQIF